MKLPCYIINLKDSLENFEKQKPFLMAEGLDPVRFIGVDGRKDEYLEYPDDVTTQCKLTCPKSAIGCGLSHVLLAQHLRDIGVPIALILEDDAFPKVCDLLENIQQTLNETPEDWEMIKLHSDNGCKNDSIKAGMGSMAAYILNSAGIQKLASLKVNYHIDHQIFYGPVKMMSYKSRWNLFWTDESSSTNRGSNTKWLNIKSGTGEKTLSTVITYNFFRIPGTNIEIPIWVGIIAMILIIILVLKILFRFTKRT